MTHVLAVRLDSDGDVLLTGPAIRALAAGSDRVTLLCGPNGRGAAELLPEVDEVLVWSAPWIVGDPETVRREDVDGIVSRLANLQIDKAVIFGSFHQSALPTALVLRMAGIPWIAATSDDYPGSLLDVRHRIHGDVHEVERSLSLARAAGYGLDDGDDGRMAVRIATEARPPFEGPYVVVHPGTSVSARAWPGERHAELVELLARSGRNVAVTGSPSERDLTASVAHGAGERVRDLGGRTSHAELALVLARASCVVVGNTGPAHLAAAVGTPVVSLFAPTVPSVRWRPWRVAHELLNCAVPCAGCRARSCPVAGHPCMSGVSASDAFAAVERLERHGRRPSSGLRAEASRISRRDELKAAA